RGETVALAYVNGKAISIVVHVIERPVAAIPPSLLRRQAEMAHGMVGSDFQYSNGNGPNFLALSSLFWSQQVGDSNLDVNSLVEDNSQFGGHTANLRTGGISYRSPHLAVNVVDFNQTLTGEMPDDHVNNFSSPGVTELRGAGVAVNRGKTDFGFFAGTTLPYYFLSLNATRDVAGGSFHRKQTDRLNLFGSTAYVNIPTTFAGPVRRRDYIMGNAGVSYRIGKGLLIGAQGGYSNAGRLLRLDASYASFRLSGYGSVISASQTYPLMQLQSLFSGTSSAKGGISYRATSRVTPGFYFDHTDIVPGLIYKVAGSNDYLSPNLAFHIARGESINFAYTYSRNTGGFTTGTTTGNRYDVSLNSQLASRVSNSAQVTVGSVQDPLQINSQDQFSVRDTISFPIKGQTVLVGVEHTRIDPSLLTKLSQELSLLSPALQAQFLANPTAFIDSTNFPPEVKALLAAEQPTGASLSAATNLAIGSKFHFNPNYSVTRSVNGTQAQTWTQSFGYSLTYQLTPTLQLRSSLNNVFLWDVKQNSVMRTMVLSAGFQKTFTTAPGGLPFMHRSRIIEGRVFRDNNINGYFNAGEPGLPGVEVRLDDGQLAVTDELGRYKFSSVSADQHQVSIALTQFHNPVRMTTRSEADVDLIQQRVAVMNFGILDFARVIGNIYNDLRFESRRQPDAKGMQDIQLLLDNGKEVLKVQTAGSGDFELDNVPPGEYKLSVDAASIPPNYIVPIDSIAVHVSPVSTAVQDIPMRALRSIAGNVLLKVPVENPGTAATKRGGGRGTRTDSAPDRDFKLVPVSGVQITAGSVNAVTDKEGKFLLRNLPAGDLKVTITPVQPVPSQITVPSGMVKLPPEPVQIEGATIVITNAELMPYITREFPAAPGLPKHATERLATVTRPVPKTEGTAPKFSEQQKTDEALPLAPAPVPATVAAAPASPAPAPSTGTATPPQKILIDNGSWPSSDTALTRSLCAQLPSLGEIAQCLRQLKLNSKPEPKK
ncbi:MAG TPA: SdrD B-like domain-containing protein, partial [Terriglobales bacterium]|nr:SdrD B-like domain-containing protein [Terriglobales bacterium]